MAAMAAKAQMTFSMRGRWRWTPHRLQLWVVAMMFVLACGKSTGVGGFAAAAPTADGSGTEFWIGVGSSDITGPATDVNMMGFANPEQVAGGVHLRLYSRAFIMANGETGPRVAFVSIDACMASQIVTMKVVERLKEKFGEPSPYTERNVAISGIHTHAMPAGFLQYVLYSITSLGFVRESFDALVDGIVKSVVMAHENLRPGTIRVNEGVLLNSNINRSPSAYLNNPRHERERYQYNQDKLMTLLRFTDKAGTDVGSVNWFAVHCTSMNRTNSLISSDNKGAASRMMEDWYNGEGIYANRSAADVRIRIARSNLGAFHGKSFQASNVLKDDKHKISSYLIPLSMPRSHHTRANSSHRHRVRRLHRRKGNGMQQSFVAAFSQSNVGDTSPNVLGAYCLDTGKPCDFNHSTCGGRNELCYGRGPAYPGDDFASTWMIGKRQFDQAKALFDGATEFLKGPVDFRHSFVDFSSVDVVLSTGTHKVVKTCKPAMGFSFAAGTTDGPGAFNFEQGDDHGNIFWRLVGSLIKPPSVEQIRCHKPKPILIDTGEANEPYPWQPKILPIQILRIGQFIILAVPGEFTTMAGRRLRESVKRTLIKRGKGQFGEDTRVVIAGLSNTYSSYVTTFEEYQVQRYEGASTIFGPHTLDAYVQEFNRLAAAMAEGKDVPQGPPPPDLLPMQLGFLPPVITDGTPRHVKFGDIHVDVPQRRTFRTGDVVEATFWAGCLRNDRMPGGTFALVERFDASTRKWVPMYDDDDWCVRLIWKRERKLSRESLATVRWDVPDYAPRGTYRLRHFGAYKHFFGRKRHYTGMSSSFVVV